MHRPFSCTHAIDDLGFALELSFMRGDELADFVGLVEERCPLLLVQGNREASQSVDGHTTLGADFERDAARPALFQQLVFSAQAIQLCLQIFVGHELSVTVE